MKGFLLESEVEAGRHIEIDRVRSSMYYIYPFLYVILRFCITLFHWFPFMNSIVAAKKWKWWEKKKRKEKKRKEKATCEQEAGIFICSWTVNVYERYYCLLWSTGVFALGGFFFYFYLHQTKKTHHDYVYKAKMYIPRQRTSSNRIMSDAQHEHKHAAPRTQ